MANFFQTMFGSPQNLKPMDQMRRMMFLQQLGGLGAGLMAAGGPVPYGQSRAGMFGQALQAAQPDPRAQMMMMSLQQQEAQQQRRRELGQQIAQSMRGGPGQIMAAGAGGDPAQQAFAAGDIELGMNLMKLQQGQQPKLPTGMRMGAAGPEYIPAYIEGQERLRKAGKPETAIYTSPTAKLFSDLEAARRAGDTERAKAIERTLEKQTQPSGEAARAREMVETGAETMGTVMQGLMPGGKVDRNAVIGAWANVPWTAGRTTNSQLLEATGLMLRLETGAAQTEGEVRNVLSRYAPSPMDSDATIKDKLTRLKQRFDRAVQIHTGKGTQPTVSTAEERRKRWGLE